jgi:hypothetical protein
VQSDVRLLLLAAPLDLGDEDLDLIELESPVGLRRRIDVEAGFSVIEVKRDLRAGSVREEAIAQLAGYVADRTAALGQRYIGLLTDGAEWLLYHLTPAGTLELVASHTVSATDPDVESLCVWLEGVLATGQQLPPTPNEIARRMGSQSPSHDLDFYYLAAVYADHRVSPTVQLKRELWAKLLTTAFGTGFQDDDALFVEHTLLVATAEIIAHAVVGFTPRKLAPAQLLSGRLFADAQIGGVVEEDFFDWVLEVPDGDRFVRSVARRLARFDWSAVEHDVMKILYESIIAPRQRHSLGEYYTPDWLAEAMVNDNVPNPLEARVLDPACGSGTFLFHAARHYLSAADAAGLSNRQAIDGLTEHVMGVDVHPVAVTLARVTYLLAIGMDRLKAADRGPISVPIYLGDSLQWDQEMDLLSAGTLTVRTESGQLFGSELRFPEQLLHDAQAFDRLVAELADRAADRPPGSAPPTLGATFRRYAVRPEDQPMLEQTFRQLCRLHDDGRDHIWGYYVRNLARPVWLAHDSNKVDVLIGNPPWLSYRFMTGEMQTSFKTMSQHRNLWAGGAVSTHQDLSGLFAARSVELYLRVGGRFAFVMPLAALSRKQFEGFRTGRYIEQVLTVEFNDSWDLDGVRPHPFPVPASVVSGRRTSASSGSLPITTIHWEGALPASNVSWRDASGRLARSERSLILAGQGPGSPYRGRFTQGASVNPRVLLIVEDAEAGPLGAGEGRRSIQSRRSRQEKDPWKTLSSLTGVVEQEFVHPLCLGSTTAPFRLLEPELVVIPWDLELLDGNKDRLDYYPGLARWWRQAEALWNEHRRSERLTLAEQLDFRHKLSGQFPTSRNRVVYTKAGHHVAAARVNDARAIVNDTLYWATAESQAEALFLIAVLNSAAVTRRVAPLQSRGQFGARHFDLYVFDLPIPHFDPTSSIHGQLVELGRRAEDVAARVELRPSMAFSTARRAIRLALDSDGVSGEIETLVEELLGAS